MTTAFPGAIDSLPRPSGNTKRNAGSGLNLSSVIDNISDAIEAIEAILGAGISTPNGVMRKLAQVNGTGASGVLEFSSIPATYRSLVLHLVGKGTDGSAQVIRLTFESSPTSGAYDNQTLVALNTSFSGAENIGANDFITLGTAPGNATANLFSAGEILLPEYANTSMFKCSLSRLADFRAISSANLAFFNTVGLWESTAAIDRIRLTLAAGSWTTTSRATLYGIPA